MSGKIPYNISEPIEPLLMLHFIQDSDDFSNGNLERDKKTNEFLYAEILETAKKIIELKNGREYDETRDRKELEEILIQYQQTRNNPFDLKNRIPLRTTYVSNDLKIVITKPNTLLSVYLFKIEHLLPYMERRIAIGFTPENVPIDAIDMTCSGENSEIDVYNFVGGGHSIIEIIIENSLKNKHRINETLIDWTKVKPSYIFVVKTGEELEPEISLRVQELQRKNNLPVVIYDQYFIKKNMRKNLI